MKQRKPQKTTINVYMFRFYVTMQHWTTHEILCTQCYFGNNKHNVPKWSRKKLIFYGNQQQQFFKRFFELFFFWKTVKFRMWENSAVDFNVTVFLLYKFQFWRLSHNQRQSHNTMKRNLKQTQKYPITMMVLYSTNFFCTSVLHTKQAHLFFFDSRFRGNEIWSANCHCMAGKNILFLVAILNDVR